MREIFKNVREKLVAKYLKNNSLKGYSKNTKKFKPRIKARIRKNKQIISKNIDTKAIGVRFFLLIFIIFLYYKSQYCKKLAQIKKS